MKELHAAFALLTLCLHMVLVTENDVKPTYASFPPTHGKQTVLIDHVHDGDTVVGFYLVPTSWRLYGCNAPEINSPNGPDARDALKAMLPLGMMEVELMGKEKYGRTMAKMKCKDGADATTLMIGAGHAKPWDGKGPKP